MSFWKFTGTSAESFPSIGLTAYPGYVYDFGNQAPPTEPAAASGAQPNPSSKWTPDAGPASDFRVLQAADIAGTYVSPASRSMNDAARASRDTAYRTWDARLSDPTKTPGLFIYGHSVVDGTGASDSYHKFATVLAGKVTAKRSNVSVVSEGHGGYTSAQLLTNLPSTFGSQPAGSVACVVLMAMLNDYYFGTAPATTKANLQNIISTMRANAAAAPHMSVIIAVEWLRSDVTAPTVPWTSYVTAAKQIADADSNVTVVDLGARMGSVAADTLGLYQADGAHPTDAGHALVANLLSADLMRTHGVQPVAPSTMIPMGLPPVAQTGWAGVTRDTDNAFLRYSDAVQNDSISYQFVGDAGHYSIALDHRQQANCGKYDLYIDGVLQGTGAQWDGYAAANADAFAQLDGFYIPSGGLHTIMLKMATKNASSSAYAGSIRGLYITRTGI